MNDDITPSFDFTVLRDLRRREDLTIGEVSKRSGVSPATISKLERNQAKAELDTLFRLSRVFGINATDLISLAESRTAHKKSAGDYASGDFRFKNVNYANVECYHGYGAKGARISRPEIHHDDYEVCWALKGVIRIALPHETHDLAAGDALQFDAILEHTYEALEDCEILILHLNKGKRF
ncbi:MAG: helix-turn-helix transcriptional regulator [Verrucomicrobia bacterium]|jgi:transcriptional regulator with XRE-family HTH domain|nr:helix-turn-helix transcriptional regulator [Verrucomicrobiota bacterium]